MTENKPEPLSAVALAFAAPLAFEEFTNATARVRQLWVEARAKFKDSDNRNDYWDARTEWEKARAELAAAGEKLSLIINATLASATHP